MTTGGGPSDSFAFDRYTEAFDIYGHIVAALAYGTSSNNSFSTGATDYTIGGVGVSGFSNVTMSYAETYRSGPPNFPTNHNFSLSRPFSVNASGSLVLVIALASNSTWITLTGLPALQIDASSSNGSPSTEPMIIAHTALSVGDYNVTENSESTFSGNPYNMADLIGVFVFAPGTCQPDQGIHLTASAKNVQGPAPFTVAFAGSANGGVAPYSYSWSFGDGANSNLQNETHTFVRAGVYHVNLTVTDSVNQWSVSGIRIDALSQPPNPWRTYLIWAIVGVSVSIAALLTSSLLLRFRHRRLRKIATMPMWNGLPVKLPCSSFSSLSVTQS
ncbi:MAG TPA: PKD domain-containing protein [Candidatus Sulfotelmatobacter sp.]|jgi:PKD repeat protein|nr:PKD domain-containing protein [Candidatus Sulfotelmatobacter sp.]